MFLRSVLKVKYRGKDKGWAKTSQNQWFNWADNWVQFQRQIEKAKWNQGSGMGTSFHAGNCRAPERLNRAYAAKHSFVCHFPLLSVLWEKLQFLSAKHNCFKTTQKQSMRDLKVSPEVLTACLVPKENTVLGTLDSNPYCTGLLTFIKTSK